MLVCMDLYHVVNNAPKSWDIRKHFAQVLIRAVTGQRSSPESHFVIKTKKVFQSELELSEDLTIAPL